MRLISQPAPSPNTATSSQREHRQPHQPTHHGPVAVAHAVDAAQHQRHRPAPLPPGRRNSTHSAGESVSALTAEISIAQLIVTANWRNRIPDSPGMKPTGTNTDSSTSEIAMMGAVICRMAIAVASAGDSSGCSSITRSTFSTTTIASSTTTPIASTIASSETVFTV